METCPRDGGRLTRIMTVSKGLRGGRVMARPPEIGGYKCENGHLLNMGERPVESEEDD